MDSQETTTKDESTTSRKRDQRNKPGQRCLLLKIDEKDYRAFRSRAVALGLENAAFFSRLVALESEHPIA